MDHHVLDVSRSVTVVSSLLGGNKEEYVEDLLEEYDELREDYYAGLEERYFLDFDKTKRRSWKSTLMYIRQHLPLINLE